MSTRHSGTYLTASYHDVPPNQHIYEPHIASRRQNRPSLEKQSTSTQTGYRRREPTNANISYPSRHPDNGASLQEHGYIDRQGPATGRSQHETSQPRTRIPGPRVNRKASTRRTPQRTVRRTNSRASHTRQQPVHQAQLDPETASTVSLRRRNAMRLTPKVFFKNIWRNIKSWRKKSRVHFSRRYLTRKTSFVVTPDFSSLSFNFKERDIFNRKPKINKLPTVTITQGFSGAEARAIAENARANNGQYRPPPVQTAAGLDEAALQRTNLPTTGEQVSPPVQKIALPVKSETLEQVQKSGYYDKPLPKLRDEPEAPKEHLSEQSETRRLSVMRPGPTKKPELASQNRSKHTSTRASYKEGLSNPGTPAIGTDAAELNPVIARRNAFDPVTGPAVLSSDMYDPVDVNEVMDFVETWGSYLRRSIAVRAMMRKEINAYELEQEEDFRRSIYSYYSNDSVETFDSAHSNDSHYSSSGSSSYSEGNFSDRFSLGSSSDESGSGSIHENGTDQVVTSPSRASGHVLRVPTTLRTMPHRYSSLLGSSDLPKVSERSTESEEQSILATPTPSALDVRARSPTRSEIPDVPTVHATRSIHRQPAIRSSSMATRPVSGESIYDLSHPDTETLWMSRRPLHHSRSRSVLETNVLDRTRYASTDADLRHRPFPVRAASLGQRPIETTWKTQESSDEN